MLCSLRRDIFLAGGHVIGVVAASRLAVSRSQQGAAVSLFAGLAGHGQCSLAQSRWLRHDKIPSLAWHGQRFAVGQNLGDIICRAELRRGWCSGKNCSAWTHLLALFISNTPLVSGGLVPPTNEKMRRTRLPPTVAIQFSPLACGRK